MRCRRTGIGSPPRRIYAAASVRRLAEEYSFKRPADAGTFMSKSTQIVVGTIGVSAVLSLLIILSYVFA
jgi:hypothetical protein